MYIYIFIYIYIVKKTDNMPSRLLPIYQWPHGNSCTWVHDVCIYKLIKKENKNLFQLSPQWLFGNSAHEHMM